MVTNPPAYWNTRTSLIPALSVVLTWRVLDPDSFQAETERAARQLGSSFLRENSSNGGKTIRTFLAA